MFFQSSFDFAVLLEALYFPILYVMPLYLIPVKLPRNHPATVRWRMAVTTAASLALGWVPTRRALAALGKVQAFGFWEWFLSSEPWLGLIIAFQASRLHALYVARKGSFP